MGLPARPPADFVQDGLGGCGPHERLGVVVGGGGCSGGASGRDLARAIRPRMLALTGRAAAIYEQWRAKGTEFLTPSIDRRAEPPC